MPDNGLSLPEFAALVVLAVEAREVPNTELKQRYKLSLDGKHRVRLNDMKLVESRRVGRGFSHTLTDSGWARLADDLGTGTFPVMSGSAGAMAIALLGWLPRYMRRTDQSLADVLQPDDPAEAADVEERIRAAYTALAARPGAWVSLTDVRDRLPDVPRSDVDATLVRMERLPDVNLVPESNQKTLGPRDRDAAVVIGDQAKHLLWIGPR
ncbi:MULTISPECIES: hypothetical protein [Nonomuraea]|uniref:MarR family transcriptional regulator n=1 Tax=Nonomuraea salmonea TaxID=46181 RepID=A0ABV5NHU3_9ACTN